VNRKGVAILAGIVLVVLAVLLATPALIDWTRYKDELATRMESALGRRFFIDGQVSFSFLPAPTFIAEDVHLADAEGGGQSALIAVPRLEVRPRLLPLLMGRLEIASLILVSPKIHLGRLPQEGNEATPGQTNLVVVPIVRQETGVGALLVAGTGVLPKASPIESVVVRNGTLIYQPADGSAWRFDTLGASFTAQTGGGGRLIGSVRLGGLDLNFEVLRGSAIAGQPTPVNLSVSTAEGAGAFRLGGQLSGTGDDQRFKGKLSCKASDLSRIVAALGDRAPALPLGNVGLSAAVNGSPHEIDIDSLTVTLGGVEGNGNASVTLDGAPQVDLKLGFGRFDLDALLAGVRGVVSSGPANVQNVGTGGAPGPAALPQPVAFTLPSDLSATIDVSAAVTVFRGELLKGAHINAALANSEVTLNQASLSLPGNSEFNLFGFLVSPQGVPSFEGSFEAASDDLRGVLDWLKIDTRAVPGDRLHAARLAGKVRFRPGEIDLDGTQMRLDGTKLDAAAKILLGDKPALGASFSIDSLNADAYWPQPKDDRQAAAAGVPAGNTVAATDSPAFAPDSWLTHFDANLKGRIGQLVAYGLTAQEVTVDGSWLQGQLSLRDFSVGDLVGAQLHVDGGVDGLAAGPVAVHGLRYSLRSKQSDRLFRQMGLSLPVDAERLGEISLSGILDGGLEALQIDSRSEFAGGKASFLGKIESPLFSPRFDGSLEATHPNLAQLLRLVAPDYHPSGGLGAMALTGHVSGDPSVLQLNELRLNAGPVTASGSARLQMTGKPRLEAALSSGEISLAPFWPITSANGHSTMVAPVREEPHHGLPAYATDRVSAAPRASVMSGAIPERWSHAPHDFSWLNRLDGALKLDARTLGYGTNRIEAVSLGIDLTNGTASLQRFGGQLFGGKLNGSGRLTADGTLALQLGLVHAVMRDALLGAADMDVADGGMDAELSVATSGLSNAEWIGRLAGTGKFAVTDGVVRGFDLKAVDERLQSLDSPTSLLALLQAGLSGGKTHFSSLSGTLRIANGLVTTDDIRLTADGGGANGQAQINLPASVMDGRAEFHLASAPSAPPLVMRLSGPLDNPHRFIDINEIQQWLVSRIKVKPKDLLKGLLKEMGR
jgi:uncharacterized protein involved in outer membrane biogenesis